MNKVLTFNRIVSAAIWTVIASPIYAQSSQVQQTWQHDGKPAQLIEMFTSEGCSSCPPADHYLSAFKQDKDLWQSKIPIAYHVDYWDYIGWKDRFAQPAFSQRQRLYKAYGAIQGVYTPGFVVDGKEWTGFFKRSGRHLPNMVSKDNGKLTLTREQIGKRQTFYVSFDGQQQMSYTAHIVLLAMDETTNVARGENKGRTLHHDFVALIKDQKSGKGHWQFEFTQWSENAEAVAVWLTKEGSFKPVQTVAGMLEQS